MESRTCRVSMAIVSSSARRRRFATTIGSDGETLSRRPSRAPAGTTVRSSVRLDATMPRRRMSSVNEVMVSSCAILGSLTNVPLSAAAHQVALADELVERGADGQPGDAEVGAELPLGRNRIADPSRSMRSSTRSRASFCFVMGAI